MRVVWELVQCIQAGSRDIEFFAQRQPFVCAAGSDDLSKILIEQTDVLVEILAAFKFESLADVLSASRLEESLPMPRCVGKETQPSVAGSDGLSPSSIGTSTYCPTPYRSRCSMAAITALATTKPVVLSAIKLAV